MARVIPERRTSLLAAVLAGFVCAHSAAGDGGWKLEAVGQLVTTNGNASGLAISGDYVYMVMNESVTPLLVYDVHEPSAPRLVKRLRAPGWPMRCRVIDGWLWTVHGNGEGFFNIADPANPILSTEPKEGPALRRVSRQTFRTHPNLTYIACANANTLFYGKESTAQADRKSEREVDTLVEQAKDALVEEKTDAGEEENPFAEEVESARTEKKVRPKPAGRTEIYDIRNPEQPILLATLDSGTPSAIQGNLLFLSGPTLQVFDVADPKKPRLLGEVEQPEGAGFYLRSPVAYGDGRLFVAIGRDFAGFLGCGPFERAQSGVAVFEARDFSKMSLLGHTFVSGALSDISALVYHKGHVLATDSAFGLRVFDVRDPGNIREVAADRQGGENSAVALLSKRRLLLMGQNLSGGLFVLDISKPEEPKTLGYFHHGLRVWGTMATYKDRYLYFQADISRPRPGISALYALDVGDPRQPKLASAVVDVARAYGLVTVDSYLYTSGGDIFDLTDPATPKRLSVRLPCSGYQIAHREPYLFVANPYHGAGGALAVVDITERGRPELINEVELPQGHRLVTMAFSGDHLFLGWGWAVLVLDLTNPRAPELVTTWHVANTLGLPRHYCHVWALDNLLFVGSYHSKLSVFDIGPMPIPDQPKCVGTIEGLPTSWLMAGEKGWIYRVCLDRLQTIRVGKDQK